MLFFMVMFLQQYNIDKLCYDREYSFVDIFYVKQVVYVEQVSVKRERQQYYVNLCDVEHFMFDTY